MTVDTYSVLLVTKDKKQQTLITAMLQPPVFDVCVCSDFNDARRRVAERVFTMILADFAEGDGVSFASDIASTNSTILLMVPSQYFEQVSYKVESSGILTITAPFDQFYFYNMIKVAIAVHYKVQIISSQTVKLKEKMEEIRLVNRAKMLLMQNRNLKEPEAHHFIEKEAMDRCIKKTAVAGEIIKCYG